MVNRLINQDYLRSIIFGFQDALVSTTGVIVGISIAVDNRTYILLTAFVTIAVEALSMAAGQYLSEKSVHDLPNNNHCDNLLIGSFLMFSSYLIGGSIPLIPVILSPIKLIAVFSVLSSFIGLTFLGFVKAKLVHTGIIRSSLEMLTIGGLTVLIGLLAGLIVKL